MVQQQKAHVLRVNSLAIVIVVEVVRGVNTARDGAVLELSLHLISTFDIVVFADVVAGHVSDGCAAFDATLTYCRGRSVAITAHINGLAAS